MDLPLHAIEARIDGARKDLPTVFGRLSMLAGHFRRAMDRGTDKTEQNPKQNMEGGEGREWFGRIRVTEFHTRLYAIYHWTDSATGVHAIQFCEQGQPSSSARISGNSTATATRTAASTCS